MNSNILEMPEWDRKEEFLEELAAGNGVRIERIISAGHASPPDFWYDQEKDEWVALLQGTAVLEWKNGRRLQMKPGDWVLLPAGELHRVAETSRNPVCIWLAVHGDLGL